MTAVEQVSLAQAQSCGFHGKEIAFSKNGGQVSASKIADELKQLKHAEPFRPVRIVLGNQQFFNCHAHGLFDGPSRPADRGSLRQIQRMGFHAQAGQPMCRCKC